MIPGAPADGMGISARPGGGGAVKVAEVGVDDRNVIHALKRDSVLSIVVGGTVQPRAIHDDVVGNTQVHSVDQDRSRLDSHLPRNLQAK